MKHIELIKKYEGLRLEAYLCPANVPTIGYGATFYPNGTKVKLGDVITRVEAESILFNTVNLFRTEVDKLVNKDINNNQLGALTSFAYNLGIGALSKSTLLKKVNVNPNDPTIKAEFLKWINANGKPLEGLRRRRLEESELYFS